MSEEISGRSRGVQILDPPLEILEKREKNETDLLGFQVRESNPRPHRGAFIIYLGGAMVE